MFVDIHFSGPYEVFTSECANDDEIEWMLRHMSEGHTYSSGPIKRDGIGCVTRSSTNWSIAEEHLKNVLIAYKEIGSAGLFALSVVINPLKARYECGERTQKLYDEIMAAE
ncbi:MAG: hypothetical protein KGI50_06130 [Patescibacteria group bacterium]|nr:hypothetical protein [Patescibacteria group bacterium]MDE2439080.1 hypothetical protein [Patescibacteria group bacterium]